MARYTVLLYPAESGGYVAIVPLFDLATEGDTVEHALEMAREAAELHVRGLIEDGEPIVAEDGPPIVASVDIAIPVPATA
jgi:predicted RNase H-like HicB family nuclease